MSNNVVGNVYQQVIEEVISASRVDFEEGGVEDGVLEELKRGWQQKLSQLEVASFPWDPKPDPPQPAASAQPPTAAAQASSQQQQQGPATQQQQQPQHMYQQQQQQHPQAQYTQATMNPAPNAVGISLPTGGPVNHDPNVKNEPYIKQEPGSQTGAPNMHAAGGLAQARAMQHISNRYGNDASSAINAGAQQAPAPALPQMQQNQARSGQPQQQQQQQQQHQQPQYALPGQQQQGFKNSQTDGAGDEDEDEADDYDEVQGILMQRDKAGTLHELGRVEIDGLLHQQFLSKAKAMEGGGLMLPLKETSKSSSAVTASRKGKERAGGVAQYDGEDDEDGPEIADEDAINSDLDDSDDEKDDDEVDDEGLGHIMLCMYDKVQRVKNKWKCVLKDGVLTVNGKEYVFHKATGEYEW
ncbi:hypothetical protein BN1723_000673, partial [Verticillium longisporum]